MDSLDSIKEYYGKVLGSKINHLGLFDCGQTPGSASAQDCTTSACC